MSRLQGRPVALLAEAARSPMAYLDADGFGEERPPFEVAGDVGIVTIAGPLLQEAYSLCGFTICDGYDAIEQRARSAFSNDSVGAVQIHMNSPGGVCVGGHELMLDLRAMAADSGKPLDVWINGSAYSMAMWLSAAAGEIIIPPSAGAGSIGVVQTGINVSGALASEGLVPIVAADPEEKIFSHGASLLPPQKEERDRMQAEVSAMMDLFALAIGDARGLTPADVRGLKAKTFMGQAAVDAKLADAVMGKRAAIERTRSKIKRKVYSMPKDDKKSQYGTAIIKMLGLDPAGDYMPEQIERVATSRGALADLGASVLQATEATEPDDAAEIVGLWRKSHAALPRITRDLATREVQLAVATGRLLPKDAYANDATDRDYPALPALHPDIAGKGLAVIRARFEALSPLPETMPTGKPRAPKSPHRISDRERGAAKRAGMTESEYLDHLSKFDSASDVSDEETDE